MIPLDLTAEEARAAGDGTLTEIRRPIDGLPPDPANVRYLGGSYLKCDAPPGSGAVSLRLPCPLGDPHPDDAHLPEHLLYGREAWRSWVVTGEEEDGDGDGDGVTYWRQTYVAYSATPRKGYRPEPDRAAITYLHESTPLRANRQLLGPWEPAETMPLWASRFAFRSGGVRVELSGGVWTWIVSVETLPVRPAEVEQGR